MTAVMYQLCTHKTSLVSQSPSQIPANKHKTKIISLNCLKYLILIYFVQIILKMNLLIPLGILSLRFFNFGIWLDKFCSQGNNSSSNYCDDFWTFTFIFDCWISLILTEIWNTYFTYWRYSRLLKLYLSICWDTVAQ